MPDSRSASERGESAKREKPQRTRPVSSVRSSDARERNKTRTGPKARAACGADENLVWQLKTGRFFKNLVPREVGGG